MAFWRRISDNVFGASGPAQIEVTPRGGNVHLRLPNQRYARDRTIPWLFVAFTIGSIVIIATLRVIIEEGRFVGPMIGIAMALVVISTTYCAWRFQWHHEILLGADFLRVDYLSTFGQRCVVQLELESIRQLTLVSSGTRCRLLAESATEAPVELLANRSRREMGELARLIVQHHAALAPGQAELRISEETDPHRSGSGDRIEPPLNSKVELATSHAGLTFDFPLPEDARPKTRRAAWRMFEFAIVVLMGAVIWFAVCSMMGLADASKFAGMALIAGLIMLVCAASKGMSSWIDQKQDDDLRQLSVVEKMLIRSSRDHRKQIWYAGEVRTIQAVVTEGSSTSEGGQVTITYTLDLVVELHNGLKAILVHRGYDPADYRPKAEYEWLATKLRHALLDEQAPLNDMPPPSTAITQLGRAPIEEHVTPTAPASPRHD